MRSSKMKLFDVLIIVIAMLLIAWVIVAYNQKLKRMDNEVETARKPNQ
jgi:hypothetical protein